MDSYEPQVTRCGSSPRVIAIGIGIGEKYEVRSLMLELKCVMCDFTFAFPVVVVSEAVIVFVIVSVIRV